MARKELEDVAQALGSAGGEESPPAVNVEDPHVRGVHAISVHPHSDGKGFLIHHHHQPVTSPDHHHMGHVSSHQAEGAEEVAEHLKEHAPKLHMSRSQGPSPMAMGALAQGGNPVDAG